MSVVQSQQGNFELKSLLLINKDERFLDIKNLMREIRINENINNHWAVGSITIEEQFNLRELLPFVGKEKIKFVWSAGEGTPIRTMTFAVRSLPSIVTQKENEIYRYSLQLVHEDFIPFMNLYAYQKHFSQKTVKESLDLMWQYYGKTITTEASSSEKIDYITHSEDITKTIDDVLVWASTPHLLYQRNNTMTLNTFDNMFSETRRKLLSNNSMIDDESDMSRNAIKAIVKSDVIQRKVVQEDGVNGYTHFDVDLFSDQYNKTDVSNTLTGKFEYSTEKSNISYNRTSRYLEDYYVMDFLQFDMAFPDSGMFLGDALKLKLKNLQNDQNDYSKYSGNWSVYGINHLIDANMSYSQQIQAIRKN